MENVISAVKVSPDRLILAQYAQEEGQMGSLMLTVICGHCTERFMTDVHARLPERENRLAAQCPNCRRWNVTRIAKEHPGLRAR